ncbi:hypothetical protein KI688_007937 [Linnemannia hyalina]|uniref:Uncharacterized protein n=1 Tax=Linnemannia hyalina TaxID=64524 RepID=A0A9P7XIR8_9FUNG|nr:hypothetical protein KI688_007937 [Linnemannia hyalina]
MVIAYPAMTARSQARPDIKYNFYPRPGCSIKRPTQAKVSMDKRNIHYIIPEIQIAVFNGTKARVKRQPEHMQEDYGIQGKTKLHQSSATLYKKLWERALTTVSASCIQDHAKDFQNVCPDNIYISMVVAYPMVCGARLPPAVEVPEKDARGVQQVVIRVSDTNFGQIFPKEHVEFIDRLKNARKRAADDVDSDDEDRSKKLRT